MKKAYLFIKNTLFSESLDFRAHIFNTLGLLGFVLGVSLGLYYSFTFAGIANTLGNFAAAAVGVVIILTANYTKAFKWFFLFTVILVFLMIFPVLFFVGGGYYSGMPCFFLFAVVFTVIMLEGWQRTVFTFLEFALYLACFLIASFYPETVIPFPTQADVMRDIIIGCMASAAVLAIAIYRHIVIYDRKMKELEEANDALGRMNRIKTEFLGNVSHELKTPLTVISGYAQANEKMLSDLPAMADMKSNMKLIASEADRLALMVSQVLDVTRIDEGCLNLDLRPVFLSQILQSTLQTYYPVFTKNNNTLELVRGGGGPVAMCDPHRVEQVLVNLISNAARHTHDGKITIGVKAKDGFAEVFVADTGEGIPLERQADLFERFQTFAENKNARTGRGTGTGLGLFICKHIVEEHGGQITVESKERQGTTVRFTLPLQS